MRPIVTRLPRLHKVFYIMTVHILSILMCVMILYVIDVYTVYYFHHVLSGNLNSEESKMFFSKCWFFFFVKPYRNVLNIYKRETCSHQLYRYIYFVRHTVYVCIRCIRYNNIMTVIRPFTYTPIWWCERLNTCHGIIFICMWSSDRLMSSYNSNECIHSILCFILSPWFCSTIILMYYNVSR